MGSYPGCLESTERKFQFMMQSVPHDEVNPLQFTVVTVTLNAEKFLRQTMVSVLAQKGIAFEYLLIDGESHDATLSIVEMFSSVDERVRCLSAPDDGISSAMNRGIQHAKGEIIAFLHADDFYPDAGVLERVAAFFKSAPDAVWLTGGVTMVDEYGDTKQSVSARRFSRPRLLRNNIILHPATFVRRDVLAEIGGFSPGLLYAMDYDVWLRLAALQSPLVVNDVLACFRAHSGSISTKYESKALCEEWMVRRKYLRNSFSKALHYSYYLLRIGLSEFRSWPGKRLR